MQKKDVRRTTDDGFSLCAKNSARQRPREIIRSRRWRQDKRELLARLAMPVSRHYARQFSFARVFDSGDGLIFDFGADSSYGFGSGYQGEPD
jgi:hypothetical protein